MAQKDVLICDIYGSTYQVKRLRLRLETLDKDGHPVVSEVIGVLDVGPRAEIRLRRHTARGMCGTTAKAPEVNAWMKAWSETGKPPVPPPPPEEPIPAQPEQVLPEATGASKAHAAAGEPEAGRPTAPAVSLAPTPEPEPQPEQLPPESGPEKEPVVANLPDTPLDPEDL